MSESVASSLMIERVLKQFPEVALVVSRTGSPEVATDLMGIELSDIFITLKPRNQWTTAKTKEDLIERMEDRLAHEIPGVGISFTQPIEMRFNELVAGVRSDIGVKVFGDDLDVLKAKADQVGRVLELNLRSSRRQSRAGCRTAHGPNCCQSKRNCPLRHQCFRGARYGGSHPRRPQRRHHL